MNQTRNFSGKPESVTAARRFATEVLTNIPARARDAVELMVSELATNCIRHANSAFELRLVHRGGELRVEVTDRTGGNPTMRSPGPDEPTGRGLQIVNLLSDSWGVERQNEVGTTVWFTLATAAPAESACSQSRRDTYRVAEQPGGNREHVVFKDASSPTQDRAAAEGPRPPGSPGARGRREDRSQCTDRWAGKGAGSKDARPMANTPRWGIQKSPSRPGVGDGPIAPRSSPSSVA
jgi:anti-sigma regulatory factor (Ser/Thr protein kinase)